MGRKGPKPRPLEERFWEKVRKTEGCWLWTAGTDKDGYGLIRLSGVRIKKRAHRLSWEMHYGGIPEGVCVLHHCDNPPCVNPEHLFLGTVADNMRDKAEKGRDRYARGVLHGKAKLTEAKVQDIRKRIAAGETQRHLAKEFGVTYQAIQGIVYNKNWVWLCV